MKLTGKTLIQMAIFRVQHFACVENIVVEKYANNEKYAKTKLFMPTTSKTCQIFEIRH